MPEEDGYELIRRARRMNGAMRLLPAVALTVPSVVGVPSNVSVYPELYFRVWANGVAFNPDASPSAYLPDPGTGSVRCLLSGLRAAAVIGGEQDPIAFLSRLA